MSLPATTLRPLVHQQTVLLTSYRRTGTPVGTPVNIAVDGDRAFVRTFTKSGKFKRIRNNPLVEVAPSTLRGRPTAPGIRARVRLLSGAESTNAARAIARKHPALHGVVVPLAHRVGRRKFGWTVHMELTPLDDQNTEQTTVRREGDITRSAE